MEWNEKQTYRIREWKETFEKAGTRSVKHVTWVPIPNRFDGKRYRKMTRFPNAAEIYGVWCTLLKVASRCNERGLLEDGDGPIDAEGLELKTGIKAECFQRCMPVLIDLEWLEMVTPVATRRNPLQGVATTGQDRTGHNRTGQYNIARAHFVVFENEEATEKERLEAFREGLSAANSRDILWATTGRGDTSIIPRTRDQVLALVSIHGWEETWEAYQHAYQAAPQPSIAMLQRIATDHLAKTAPSPEERQKDQARTESPAGRIKARHDEARRLGMELLFTPKPGKCFVIEVADYSAVVMRPKNGGDAITAKGPEIARDFGKHLGDEYWTTEELEEVTP